MAAGRPRKADRQGLERDDRALQPGQLRPLRRGRTSWLARSDGTLVLYKGNGTGGFAGTAVIGNGVERDDLDRLTPVTEASEASAARSPTAASDTLSRAHCARRSRWRPSSRLRGRGGDAAPRHRRGRCGRPKSGIALQRPAHLRARPRRAQASRRRPRRTSSSAARSRGRSPG